MTEKTSPPTKKKTFKIQMDVDVNAVLQGFDSAKIATRAHRRVMRNFASPLLAGPPESEDFLEMIMHMFTEEEAEAAQHLLPMLPLTAGQVARRVGRPAAEVKELLENLADNKRVILSFGSKPRYTILPIVPGTFEMAVMTPDLSRSNRWHKKFSELFEKVWDSAYITGYLGKTLPPVRYLLNQSVASHLQSALPCDKLEEVLEPYDLFGIAHCQCRVVTQLAGKGCGKPTENCVAIGPMAKTLIERGRMRKADREEVIEAKRIAEDNGCITWMMNGVNAKEGNYSCSCCGCCCHAMRTVTQFSAPNIFTPPRYIPKMNDEACNHCGRCAAVCPMGAWKKIGGAMFYEQQRCIGCGLCVTSCKPNALTLVPAPVVKPERDFGSLALKIMPSFVSNAFKVWLRRTAGFMG